MSESPSIHIPYPWQQEKWQYIQLLVAKDKIPHAILLAGQKGIGKWHFAHALADYLLCSSPRADLACGKCRSCQLLLADTHPDKQIFLPEEEGKSVKIDQIRQLSSFVSKTAQQGGRKVVILGPVEQLNSNAANAVLKSLEEPSGDTVLILVSHVSSAVMATIRSRCQLLSLTAPNKTLAVQWLKDLQIDNALVLLHLAGGAPLIAKEMVDGNYLEHLTLFMKTLDGLSQRQPNTSIVSMAKMCLAINLDHITEWWLQIIHGMLAPVASEVIDNYATSTTTENITEKMHSLLLVGQQYNRQWLFRFSDKLVSIRKQQLSGANPNMQLLLEELFLDWQVIVQRS